MDDTTPAMRDKVYEMMRAKSPVERFEMGCSMYEFSKELVIRGILESNPQISKTALRQEFFLKFYGNDFEPELRDKILKAIELRDSEIDY